MYFAREIPRRIFVGKSLDSIFEGKSQDRIFQGKSLGRIFKGKSVVLHHHLSRIFEGKSFVSVVFSKENTAHLIDFPLKIRSRYFPCKIQNS